MTFQKITEVKTMNIKNNDILENAQSKRYFNGYVDQLNRPAYNYPDIENAPIITF